MLTRTSKVIASSLRLCSVAGGLVLLLGCIQAHPDDVERDDIPDCATTDLAVMRAEDFFAGADPWVPAEDRPEDGETVAVVGWPRGGLLCTQLGCSFDCCDNSCGFMGDCAYSLEAGHPSNQVCLSHEDFACGGTDCSPYCRPFGRDPRHQYRFVGEVFYEDGPDPIIRVKDYCREG